MRGFQPRSAAGAKEQRFADGGFVQGIKRAFGMDEERNAQIAAYRARAAAEQAQAQQQTPQPQQRAVTQYSGMSATQRREKELGLADGGRVRPRGFVSGKGTATSDSIPAQLSNGEYVLPADTVRAVGVDKLDALLEETHEPVRGFAPKAAPEEPRQFFGNGGAVKRLHLADAGEVTRKRLEEEGRVPGGAPSPTNIFPGNRLPGDSGSTSAAPAAPAAPSSAPVAAGFMPGTRAVFNESGKAIGDLAKQGRYGAAAGETARAALAYVPAVADDVIGGAVRAVAPGIADAGRQFLGMNDGAAAAITNPTDARLAAGTRRAPSGFAPAIKPQVAAAPTVPQQAPVTAPVQRMAQQPQAPAFDFDNFQPAPGQGAFRNEQTGEVTRLQDGPSPTRDTRIWKEPNVLPRSDARPAAQRQEVRAPVLNPNGGVFSSMVDFTNQAGQAVQAIAANKGMRNDRKDALDQQRVGLDAASTFAKIEQGDRALGIDQQRLGMEATSKGFDARQAQRKENAQLAWDKASPEQRSVMKEMYPDLFGNEDKKKPYSFDVVRGSADPMTGKREGDYAVVFDPNTGKYRQVQIGQ